MSERGFRLAILQSGCGCITVIGCVMVAIMGCNHSPDGAALDATPAAEAAPLEGGTQKLTLDEEQREYLWQIEHHGLLLSKHGFGAIKQALIRNDAKALHVLLAN